MPTDKTTVDKPLPANKQKGKKVCTWCHKEKKLTDFYLNYSPMYSLDQRNPVCKDCCKSSCLNDDGSVNMDKLKDLLRQIDRPLYYDLISSAEKQVKKENSFISDAEVKFHGEDILSKYFTGIAKRQDRAKSYSDAEKEGFFHQNSNRTLAEKKEIRSEFNESDNFSNQKVVTKNQRKEEDAIYVTDENFEVTDNMITLFGDGYAPTLYKKMQDKYDKLKINYSLQTNIHQEALATYVRFKVQEELATAKGDVTEAKKWYDAAQSSAQDAKLTPKQLTKADLDGGVNSVSELTKALEQAVDVIKIMPRFKYRPNDAPDFNIWCYVGYERKLNDQPDVSYEDVYKFYDKKKKEYLEQNGDPYGIFVNDTTENNRETVKTFIKLPDDYDDLAGDENDN